MGGAFEVPEDDQTQIFCDVAVSTGMMAQEQVEECRKIRDQLSAMGLTIRSMPQIALEKEYITADQVREIQREMIKRGHHPRVAGYELMARIGAGGMGTVYRARQLSLDRMVAFKILPPELARDESYIERFVREAKLAARLSHPNAIQVFDVGEDAGRHFIVMELVDGAPVSSLVERGAMDEQQALRIILQVAGALAEAHDHSIIHRDIKPSNILLTSSGIAKLADLGLAKDVSGSMGVSLTVSGASPGTPHYMSPEQCNGLKDIDGRTDIYSLGITLYRMVCGSEPYKGPTPMVVMRKHIDEPLPDPGTVNPSLSAATTQLIRDMTAKDRDARLPNCREVIRRIELVLQGGTTTGMGEQPIAPEERMPTVPDQPDLLAAMDEQATMQMPAPERPSAAAPAPQQAAAPAPAAQSAQEFAPLTPTGEPTPALQAWIQRGLTISLKRPIVMGLIIGFAFLAVVVVVVGLLIVSHVRKLRQEPVEEPAAPTQPGPEQPSPSGANETQGTQALTEHVAFVAERGGRTGLWVMRQDGTDYNRICDCAAPTWPAWHPGRNIIAIVREDDGRDQIAFVTPAPG